MIFVDTNVVIDLLESTTPWHEWSSRRVEAVNSAVVNSIVVAECAPRFETLIDAMAAFDMLEIKVEDLPMEVAFDAGQVFRRYRRDGRRREKILADFLIGAHARMLGTALLTRDAALYRAYFPELTLITPENDHG